MPPASLNLGILAHVDAGKTTLTERLLFLAGVIDEIGSVDAGTTQTDSMALERQRGITIRSAVVSLAIDGRAVNLIDTPGHPDFIAEVERVLSVLDGAILVISAVEGVQPQTRVLMRALQRLRVPTLLFVNKIDRRGADPERVLAGIAARLTQAAIPMGRVVDAGLPSAALEPWLPEAAPGLAEALAANDDDLLAGYVDDPGQLTPTRLRKELVAQTARALVHPVFFGSAITGAGVEALMAALAELLPAAIADTAGPVAARVFKIERGSGGEKVAYVRMFSGTVRTRDRLSFGRGDGEKATGISVFERGTWLRRSEVSAGQIGKLWGLATVHVGDTIGDTAGDAHYFAPPMLETVVAPSNPADGGALRSALAQLAEQDPLINVRQDDLRQEISVSLYGEVQKEVIQATLADEYGIAVTFRETTTICVERPVRVGEAAEVLNAPGNPFRATVGLRIEPAPPGSGIEFRLRVHPRTIPVYVYKNVDNFAVAMEQYVRQTLGEGLRGWQVTDCVVTMVRSNYSSPDGPPSTRGPLSTAADFRRLTPLVLMQALKRARTTVCEPVVRADLEIPAGATGGMLSALGRLGVAVEAQVVAGDLAMLRAHLPVPLAQEVQRRLPGLTGGEGVLETTFYGYQPVRGVPPNQRRLLPNPLNREEYLLSLTGLGVQLRQRDGR